MDCEVDQIENGLATRLPFQCAMADVVPAAAVEPGRADNALAYYITQLLRVAVVREMQQLQSHRSDLAPFALTAWCPFTTLERLPHLRTQCRFPVTWLGSAA